jgi:hypothetical protein
MTQPADTAVVVSLDGGADEPSESAEPGMSKERAGGGQTQTTPGRSDGPPPTRPNLW